MDAGAIDERISKMTQFIVQEAEEKANEILASAIEEAELQRTKLIQTERIKLNKEFEKHEMRLQAAKKISISTSLSKARLEALNAQQTQMQRILQEAAESLSSITTKDTYRQFMIDLVVQGIIKINKPDIVIRARKQDIELVKSIITDATDKYQKIHKNPQQVKLSVDESKFVKCTGGVVLTALDNKIVCDNTLDTRLLYAYNVIMPSLRKVVLPDSKSLLIK